MLIASRVAQALEGRKEEFQTAARKSADMHALYSDALDRLIGKSVATVTTELGDEPWPGALPTEELDTRGLIVPFDQSWQNAQDARSWALQQLRGVPTIAVDGSQIAASKEFGVPVSLVQVAWFENYHRAGQPYVKNICNEIVTAGPEEREVEEYAFAESRVNRRRFELEMQVAVERLTAIPSQPLPVVFVDGSLVLSFVERMTPMVRGAYVSSLMHLLLCSAATRVPVLGYVDFSFASDLVALLRALDQLPTGGIFDARLLAGRMKVFDRTAAFVCARGDVLPYYRTAEHDESRGVCFVYLKTGSERLPSRIDFPRWVLDAGLLDYVVNIVRAEIVVGSGYPYALETADATAVLSAQDRMTFYDIFQEFARSAGLDVPSQGKSISKSHRR